MDKNFFIDSRKRLADLMEDNSILVMFAGASPYKTADERYPFTPNRNFYYLTGVPDENVKVVMIKIDGKIMESIFVERVDPVMVKWVGATISNEEAKEISGIKDVKYLDEFNSFISNGINRFGLDRVYLDLERQNIESDINKSQAMAKELRDKYPHIEIKNIHNNIAELRMIKEAGEVEKIKRAIEITKDGIDKMMENAKPGMKEYELEAYFDYTLLKNGVRDKAFKTIAAAGINATTLHYEKNNAEVKDGDLVLFDLGAQFEYYNADISRTFPVSGKFTDRQKDVYNAVLKAQKAVEAEVKPGISFGELNKICQTVLGEECIKLGLIEKVEEIGKYFFHGFGHYLGLDTHDVGKRGGILKEGMVITNEPGLYIEEESIGIRIEDDLLITKDGCENLCKDVIKEVDDIEKFMASRK